MLILLLAENAGAVVHRDVKPALIRCICLAAEPENLGRATRHQRAVPGDGVLDLTSLVTSVVGIVCRAPFYIKVFDTPLLKEISPTEFAAEIAPATRSVLERVGA